MTSSSRDGSATSPRSRPTKRVTGGSGSIVSFNLAIKKMVAGVNPISARCTDGKLKVHVLAKFEDGTKAETEIVRACSAKG